MRWPRLYTANRVARRLFRMYHELSSFWCDAGDPPLKWEHLSPEEKKETWGAAFGSYRKTKVFCSSPRCCGNPRRRGEKTLHELRADDFFEEQMEEVL